MKLSTFGAALLLATVLPLATAADVNNSARRLAGLEASTDPKLQALFQATNATWANLRSHRIADMQAFAGKELPAEQTGCKTLFYPFSGPDVLNAVTLFPNCTNYVLFGLEPVGLLPDMDKPAPKKVTQLVQAMGKAQDYLVRRNFFVTQYMGKDLRTPQLNGVVPLMSVMLVRMGYEIRAIEPKSVDGKDLSAKELKSPHAVVLTFGKPGQPSQTVFYSNFDASDAGLKAHPQFVDYMKPNEGTVTMLKAASYLLHGAEFSTMKALVLEKSAVIVQDDTGVPYKALVGAGYDVKLFGHYKMPIDTFKYRFQPDLLSAYSKVLAPQPDLAFAWSYNWDFSEVGLQLAHKKH